MQLIEGPKKFVVALYDRIQRDSRHDNVVTLDEGLCAKREFGDWSMGFQDLLSPEVQVIPGYSKFLDMPLTDHELARNVSLARQLLNLFKKA